MQKPILTLLLLLSLLVNTYGQDKHSPVHTLNDTAYIQELFKKVNAIPSGSLTDSAINIYAQTALLSEKAGYARGVVLSYAKIGSYNYDKKHNCLESISVVNLAIPYFNRLKKQDQYLIPTLYNLKGICFAQLAMYDSAVYYYRCALTSMDSLNIQRPQFMSMTLNNIGTAFINLRQLPTAISYYRKALEIPGVDSSTRAEYYGNIAVTYANLINNMDSATYWWQKALTILHEQKKYDRLQFFYANMSIGWQASEHQDLIKSARYLDSAVRVSPATAYTRPTMLRAAAIQEYYKGNYRKAIDYCQRLIKLSHSESAMLSLSESYMLLSYCYAFLGDQPHTNEYQLKYSQLSDKINNEDIRRSVNALEIKYKISEKERALAKSEVLAYRQRNWLILVIGSFLLAAILFIAYFRNSRQRRRLDTEKINSLEQQQQIQSLHTRMEAEENERIRISGELHDGLGVLISAAKLNNTLLKKNIGAGPQRMQSICTDGASILDNIHQEMRSIAHNLNPEYQLSHKGLYEALTQLATKLESDAFHTRISVYGEPQALHPQRGLIIYRIMEEVINNSLRHSQGNLLDIQLVYTDTDLNITAEDNGVGFNVSAAIRGIGISNMERRAKQLGGHLILNSEKGKGCVYMITIPYEEPV